MGKEGDNCLLHAWVSKKVSGYKLSPKMKKVDRLAAD